MVVVVSGGLGCGGAKGEGGGGKAARVRGKRLSLSAYSSAPPSHKLSRYDGSRFGRTYVCVCVWVGDATGMQAAYASNNGSCGCVLFGKWKWRYLTCGVGDAHQNLTITTTITVFFFCDFTCENAVHAYIHV